MKSNYKKIGAFVRQVSNRNTDLSVTNLKGININKEFMPSVANINGTDLSKYKVVQKGQFAFNPMHVGRDEMLPISLWLEDEPIIVSPAYVVFEILDHNILDPNYLMMWCKRSEFDRNCWFTTDSSVRGGFSWDNFCDLELPLPSLDTQQLFINEFDRVIKEIHLCENIEFNLSLQSEILFRKWFLDLDDNSVEKKFNDLIELHLPSNFVVEEIGNFVDLLQGQVINATTNHLICDSGIPLLRIQDLKNNEECIFMSEDTPKSKICDVKDIIVSRTGVVGLVFRNRIGVVHNNCFTVKSNSNVLSNDYLYYFLRSSIAREMMINLAGGSVQSDLSHVKFNTMPIIIPPMELQNKFCNHLNNIENFIECKISKKKILKKLGNVLLSKMSQI